MKKIAQLALFLLFCLVTSPIVTQNNRPNTSNVQDMEIFYHTIESGQTVYSIAKMYDVMVSDIHKLNPGSENRIKAGEQLKIPQRKFEEKSILNLNNTSVGNDNDYIIHTIKANETLLGLANQYNVNPDSILRVNTGLSRANFTVGRKIRIPKPVILKPSSEVVVRNGMKEVYYKVPTGETYYNICRLFKTTEAELLQMNPELAGGLRAGMTIRIPLRINEIELPKDTDTKPVTPAAKPLPRLVNAVKVALLLPFNASAKTDLTEQMIEYYQGMLIASETLKSQGLSMELFVYDIGDDFSPVSIRRVLQEKSEELKKVNLLIGGGYNVEQIKLIADFAKQNKIKYVIPFSPSDEFAQGNEFIFQVNTPTSYMNAFAANAGANLFGKHNVIFLDTKDTLARTEFIREFKQELKDRYISYKEAVYDPENFLTNMQSLLSDTKPNMIMSVSESKDALLKIKGTLRMIAETQPEFSLTLYGYTRWLTFLQDCLEDFYVLDTYIYSRFYLDNTLQGVKVFHEKYKNWYNRSPVQTYPQWAMFGYDTGMFFFTALHRFGVNFEDKIPEMYHRSLQTGFNFIRINDGSGFINSNIYIVHYGKDFNVTRSEFK